MLWFTEYITAYDLICRSCHLMVTAMTAWQKTSTRDCPWFPHRSVWGFYSHVNTWSLATLRPLLRKFSSRILVCLRVISELWQLVLGLELSSSFLIRSPHITEELSLNIEEKNLQSAGSGASCPLDLKMRPKCRQGSLGRADSYLSGVWGEAPTANGFWWVLCIF
jgi:hypothetical protein